jgi:hypothetical protein
MSINNITIIKNPDVPVKSFKIKRINSHVSAMINGIWSQEDEKKILELANELVINRGFSQSEINAIHTEAFSVPDRVETHLVFVENLETGLPVKTEGHE